MSEFTAAAIAHAIATARATKMPTPVDHENGNQFDDGENTAACGDYSLGAEPSIRYVYAHPFTNDEDSHFTVVDIYRWVSAVDAAGQDIAPWDLADHTPTGYRSNQMAMITTCGDISNFEETILDEDNRHTTGPVFRTRAEAEAFAATVQSMTPAQAWIAPQSTN